MKGRPWLLFGWGRIDGEDDADAFVIWRTRASIEQKNAGGLGDLNPGSYREVGLNRNGARL